MTDATVLCIILYVVGGLGTAAHCATSLMRSAGKPWGASETSVCVVAGATWPLAWLLLFYVRQAELFTDAA